MEIHELNTFTGSPGANDYLATDNGVDTSKISIPTITDPLNARIDNIITSPAPSAEEIIDARLGANGFAYPSLGDAIRGQFTDIQRVVNDGFMPEVDYVTADCSTQTSSADSGTHNGVTWTRISGTEWKANGTASSAGSFRNLIGSTSTVSTRFYAGQKLKINVSTTSPSLVLRVYCYTESNTVADHILNSVRFGGGCINDCIIHLATSEMPFGGVGESGMGCYHGKFGFEEFSHFRSIVDKKTWLDLDARYQPYTDKKLQIVHNVMK